ncbi:hypothetical protein CJD36_021345 [Flavipsychrobacter stenotrophus]|uniref:Uncharacterized protein n=1 Tax=Flavipsychrobacter stenotrophus TaxID=2077091 RepID=A0A2S7SQR0_9BACT|nr:hypothetical protein [Flavipsychrobacter stenotrophus]PQJ08957.1 hypothetical protein CJD36_021345 [Flavipsychrobacter stenotrophus]
MLSDVLLQNKNECIWYINHMRIIINKENNRIFFRNDREIEVCERSIRDFKDLLKETENLVIRLTYLSFSVSELNIIANYINRNKSKMQSLDGKTLVTSYNMDTFKDFHFKKIEKMGELVDLLIDYNNIIYDFELKKTDSFYRQLRLRKISLIDDLSSGNQNILTQPSFSTSPSTSAIKEKEEPIFLKNETEYPIYYAIYKDRHAKIKIGSGIFLKRSANSFDLGYRHLNIIFFPSGFEYPKGGFGTLKSGFRFKFVLNHSKSKIILLDDK